MFENENPSLRFEISKQNIEISTSYHGDYIFQVESAQTNKIRVKNTECIKAVKGNIIQLRNKVSVECGNVPYDIYYINMNPNARSPRWLVYQYKPETHEDTVTNSYVIEQYLGY